MLCFYLLIWNMFVSQKGPLCSQPLRKIDCLRAKKSVEQPVKSLQSIFSMKENKKFLLTKKCWKLSVHDRCLVFTPITGLTCWNLSCTAKNTQIFENTLFYAINSSLEVSWQEVAKSKWIPSLPISGDLYSQFAPIQGVLKTVEKDISCLCLRGCTLFLVEATQVISSPEQQVG